MGGQHQRDVLEASEAALHGMVVFPKAIAQRPLTLLDFEALVPPGLLQLSEPVGHVAERAAARTREVENVGVIVGEHLALNV